MRMRQPAALLLSGLHRAPADGISELLELVRGTSAARISAIMLSGKLHKLVTELPAQVSPLPLLAGICCWCSAPSKFTEAEWITKCN